jgi:hypothetical protein
MPEKIRFVIAVGVEQGHFGGGLTENSDAGFTYN